MKKNRIIPMALSIFLYNVASSEFYGMEAAENSIYDKSTIHGSISGFPEFLPPEQIVMQDCIKIIRGNYEKFGYIPLETPSVERIEVLESKGIDGKEVYGLRRLNTVGEEDDGRKELALRFDLTVPLARYVAEHFTDLSFPFKRYQIQPVWRGERASTGRYREFYQCDIDIIGQGDLSLDYDAEVPAVIYKTFRDMNIGDFIIRINNRKILEGLFNKQNLSKSDVKKAVRIIDNAEKVSREDTIKELVSLQIEEKTANDLMFLFSPEFRKNKIGESLKFLKEFAKSGNATSLLNEGISELEYVTNRVLMFDVPENSICVDLGVARGLDYYTGTVYETTLIKNPEIGSICSGGRFEDLVGVFSSDKNKKFPGVGASIGLTRLVPQLIKMGIIKANTSTTAPVLITSQEENGLPFYSKIASHLRDEGISTEIYLNKSKLRKQLDFANKKGFLFAVIARQEEIDGGKVNLKNMITKQQDLVNISDLANIIKKVLKK